MSTIDARLSALGIELPSPPPPRTARIQLVKIADRFPFVSGQLPSWNGSCGTSARSDAVFGAAGAHTRTAIGVAMMPYNAAIEVDAQFLLRDAA